VNHSRSTDFASGSVYLTPGARARLAKLDPSRREALTVGFRRVGHQLLESAEQVAVPTGWARHTWPRRRYPQQCYSKTLKYVREHADILGIRLVHGVVSHPPHFLPLDHAWIELPGQVVFDAVLQAFFTRLSYYNVMSAMVVQTYSAASARRLATRHHHDGPWNAKWAPTDRQLEAYGQGLRALENGSAHPPNTVRRFVPTIRTRRPGLQHPR
jgi:hypothetical protein